MLKTAEGVNFSEVHLADRLSDYNLLHTHIGTVSSNDELVGNDYCKHIMPPVLQYLMDTYNVVIPLRDPVRAIITRQARHPELGHMHILKAFEYLTHMDGVFFLPVDLAGNFLDKMLISANLFKFCDLNMTEKTVEYITKWEAPTYNKVYYDNKTQGGRLLKAYAKRNWKYMRESLGEELDYLKDNKQHIKAFMQEQGYKDLPWFHKSF
jgi:hypothetical protein